MTFLKWYTLVIIAWVIVYCVATFPNDFSGSVWGLAVWIPALVFMIKLVREKKDK